MEIVLAEDLLYKVLVAWFVYWSHLEMKHFCILVMSMKYSDQIGLSNEPSDMQLQHEGTNEIVCFIHQKKYRALLLEATLLLR